MKRLILALLFLFATPVPAAWQGNGTDQFIAVTDNAALDFADSDWTFALYVYVDGNAGTSTNFIAATSTSSTANPSFMIACRETSHATDPGKANVVYNDDDTTDISFLSAGAECDTTGSWRRWVIQRSGTTITLYIDGSSVGSGSNAAIDALSPAAWNFFSRTDGTLPIPGRICDVGKWSRALSTAEIATLTKFSAGTIPQSRQFWIPGIREYTELQVPLTLTNTSTTVVECPGLIYAQ